MSFAEPLQAVIITPLANRTAELIDRVPQEADSGWDTMRDTYLVRYDTGMDPKVALDHFHARDTQVSGFSMWVVNRTARCVGPGIFRMEVVSMGLLSARGYKVRYGSASDLQTKDNVVIDGVTHPHAALRESSVAAELEYVAIGLSPSSITELVGTASPPPSPWAPAVRASIWAGISDPTYHYPNGWIYDTADMENLPGLTTVWLVKARYLYQYPYSA
jgi:hypothetical protein